MNSTSKPYIGSAILLLGFRDRMPKVRFEQAAAEAAFSDFIGAPSQQTNIPDDADPNQPRILFSSGNTAILISQMACQLRIVFEKSDLGIIEQLQEIHEKALAFSLLAYKFLDILNYAFQGFIIEINLPVEGSMELAQKEVYDRIIKAPALGEIASMQILVGYEVDGMFVNFTTSAYEARTSDMPASELAKLDRLHLQKLELTEVGISVKVDVNNRANGNLPNSLQSTADLLNASTKFLRINFATNFGINLN
jgi:hypothetical protein